MGKSTAASPLCYDRRRGFMDKVAYESVVENMRLGTGGYFK
jgi:hypothetical protein